MSEQKETNTQMTVWHAQPNAREAVANLLGIVTDAIGKSGSIATFPDFAIAKGVELDKTAANYDRDAVKALRAEFNSIRAEYWSKAKPNAAGIMALDGFHVRSLQPKYSKDGSFIGANISVRREMKSAKLTLKSENAILRRELAELRAKLAALPA
jgi:hypothetical protein